MRTKLIELQQKIEMKRGHDPDLDVHMWRLRRGNSVGKEIQFSNNLFTSK